jgi:hypothetical protein
MHGRMAIHRNTPGWAFAGCGAIGLLLVILLPVVLSERGRRQAKVTVDWNDTTNENGDAWKTFVISNAGPSAIEWDLGHYQWADLNPAESFPGAFVMGYSGRLAPGEVDSLDFPRPTRPNGTWRYGVPCRRAQGITERLRARLRDRFPRWIDAPKDTRQVWMAASAWTRLGKP